MSVDSPKISDSKFGIEFETCVIDIVDGNVEDNFQYFPIYTKKANEILKENGIEEQLFFDNSLDILNREYDEKTYRVEYDITVECKSQFVHLDKKYPVHIIEIVTPIIGYYKNSIDTFQKVYDNVIKHPDFLYEVNDSQGLHITISHPNHKTKNFLQFFWYFEPIIIRFLPFNRQLKLEGMAKPLRSQFTNFEDIDEKIIKKKYSAVNVRKDSYEIRIINPDIYNYDHIYWVHLLIGLLWCSITIPIEKLDITKSNDLVDLFKELFDILETTGTDYSSMKKHFTDVYKKYNSIDK